MTPDPVPLNLTPPVVFSPPQPPQSPQAAAVRAVAPARHIKVIQFGPALSVRGGVTTVEQHICDYLPAYVSMRHIATMEHGSIVARAAVFARAVHALNAALQVIEPCIVHIHFSSRGSTLRKLILANMVLRAGRPLVLHAHGGAFDKFHRGLPAVLRRTVNGILQRANVLVTLSSRWRDFYVEECEVSPSHVTVLPNPVRWTPEVPNRAGRRQVQFLFLGRMSQMKGTYDLVNAFAALPQDVRARAQLVLAGDGDLDAITKLAAPLGERVRVLSWIDTAERERLLAQSDVFVLPSYNEGVPMSLLESMASGLPSIVTPVGGIPDVLRHGVEGLMVEPRRVADLAAAMAKMVTDDAERLACGKRAHERARLFEVHGYARRLADIYQRIAPVAEYREFG
jgi:glycosyltransferase involved in cell wall biosynthesis